MPMNGPVIDRSPWVTFSLTRNHLSVPFGTMACRNPLSQAYMRRLDYFDKKIGVCAVILKAFKDASLDQQRKHDAIT